VQPPKLGTGLDADLLDERGACAAVRGKGVRLAAGAVQGEHALGVQALAQGMLGDELVDSRQHLAVAPGRELLVDRRLERAGAQLLQPPDLGGRERLAPEVRQRVVVPQGERLVRLPFVHEPLEADGVDAIVRELERVAATVGGDRGAVALDRPPQVGDVELHHLRRARRWMLAPQPLGELVDRHRVPRPDREHRQHGALFGRAERQRASVEVSLDGPEETEVHAR